MVKKQPVKRTKTIPFIANSSSWLRANASGIVNHERHLGDRVKKGDLLAEIGSPYGEIINVVQATRAGIIIGKQNIPLVQEGEAMYHIAYFSEDDALIAGQIENVQGQVESYGQTVF